MIILWIACCTQHRWVTSLATISIMFPRILATALFQHWIIRVMKGAGQMPYECTRVSLRQRQGKDVSSILSACVRLIDCYWKLSNFILIQVGTADTQQVELMHTGPGWLFVKVSWKLLVWGDGKRSNIPCMDYLSVCVPVVQLIYISFFICGQSVASCSANCSQRLCHRHFSRHDVPNEKTTIPFPDILWKKHLQLCFHTFIDATWLWCFVSAADTIAHDEEKTLL